MTTGSLDNQLQQYWSLLETDQKRSILSMIRSFVKPKEAMAHVPQRLTIEEYNKELETAEAEMDAGHFYTHEEVMEMAKKW